MLEKYFFSLNINEIIIKIYTESKSLVLFCMKYF